MPNSTREIQLTLIEPHPAQLNVLAEAKRFNVLVCGRRWGKTTLLTNLLIEPSLDGYEVGWFGTSYKNLEEVWNYLVSTLTDVIATKDEQNKRLDLITGGVIELWSLDSPKVVRGRKYKRVIIDEVPFIRKIRQIWQSVIRPTLTDYRGDAWFLGSPGDEDDEGLFFEEIYNRGQSTDHPEWVSWQRPTLTNPYIDPEEIAQAQKDLEDTPDVFKREYGAEFARGTVTFLPSSHLWDICKGNVRPLENKITRLVLGVDGGVTNDHFALIGVTPRYTDPFSFEVTLVRQWIPKDGISLDFNVIQAEIKQICQTYKILSVAYDKYQLHQMMQNLAKIVPVQEFSQQGDRAKADIDLLSMIMQGRIIHDGNLELKQHLSNANKQTKNGQTRMVKRTEKQKIDLAVALSMAVGRAMEMPVVKKFEVL